MIIEQTTEYAVSLTKEEAEKLREGLDTLESIMSQMEEVNCKKFKNYDNDMYFHINEMEDTQILLKSLLCIELIY